MFKKIGWSVLLAFMLVAGPQIEVVAETQNVKDCLEHAEECTDPSTGEMIEKQEDEDIGAGEMNNSSLVFDLIKMVFALGLVLALIYLLLKFLNKRNTLHQQKSLQNIGGISVGQNKSVQIIKVGTTFYLIGVGDNVELLKEISDQDLIDDLLDDASQKENVPLNKYLSSIINRPSKKNERADSQANNDFKQLFSDELDRLKENRNKIIKQYKDRIDYHE